MKYSSNNIYNIVIAILTVIITFWVFKDIHYTDDFESYERFYTGVVERQGDIGYSFLEEIAGKYDLSFFEFYNYVIFLQIIAFTFVFIKYNVNSALGMLCTVFTFYVQMANQLRYFLALPLFLLGVYYLFVEKRFILSTAILALSLSFHNGIVTLFTFIPIYFYIKRRVFKKSGIIKLYVILGFIGLISFSSLFRSFVDISEKFSIYEGSHIRSLATLYLLVMPSLCLYILWSHVKGLVFKKMSETTKLSFALSFFAVIWAIVSFSGTQIINARYVNALFPIWTILMLRSNKDLFNREISWSLFLLLLVIFVCKYLIPSVLFDFSDWDKIQIIWMSKTHVI